MDKIESVQYSAALAVTGAWRATSHEKIYVDLGWELLSSLRLCMQMMLFYKIMNNIPLYTKEPIPPPQHVHYFLQT